MAKKTKDQWLWVDPDPDVGPGMLLSDRIEFYAKLGMIVDFKDKNLKPASYGLTLGDECYVQGKYDHVTNMPDRTLVIKPNSYVVVTVAEELRMPFYIAGRFNLKIDMVYQGLLLGTGPQVDPGFPGHLYCPLHNISSRDIPIKFGDRFATIDFIKTTPFTKNGTSSAPFDNVLSEDELRNEEGREQLKGFARNPLVLFPLNKKRRKSLHDYIREATGCDKPGVKEPEILSSVNAIQREAKAAQEAAGRAEEQVKVAAEKAEEQVKNSVRFAQLIQLALVVALGVFVWYAWSDSVNLYRETAALVDKARDIIQPMTPEGKTSISEIQKTTAELTQKLDGFTKEIGDLKKEVRNLRRDVEEINKKPAKIDPPAVPGP